MVYTFPNLDVKVTGMRRVLVFAAVMAASAVGFAIPASPALADSASGESNGGGSYSVQVSVTGSGVGSGGSLPGGSAVSSSGGSVSVPSPCGYGVATTQESIEALVGGDKAAYAGTTPNYGPGGPESFPVSVAWREAILANWGKSGTWYLPECDSSAQGKLAQFTAENPPALVGPGGLPAPPVPLVDLKLLEAVARDAMTLPKPVINYNPRSGAAAQTYVNVPGGTWFWATPSDGKDALKTGGERSVTASVPGRSVTVTARIDSITFKTTGVTKNGSTTVSCPDGGKPYTAGAASTASSCMLDYARSSGLGTYQVTSAVAWSASSSLGTTLAGAVMTDSIQLRVGEIQTVNR